MLYRYAIVWCVLLLACTLTQCTQSPTGPAGSDTFGLKATEEPVPTEESGNCLSFPVIWSDGVAKSLRGTFGVTSFDGAFTAMDDPSTAEIDVIPWYHQGDAGNEWQAETRDQTTSGPLEVSCIDWGDNLEAKAWDEGSVVRTEVVLFQDLAAGNEMVGYVMGKLNDVSGPGELWGASGNTYLSNQATVYSGCARLTIQKLSKKRDDASLSLTWNSALGEWEGDVAFTVFNGGVWESTDGPGFYSAELNVQGKCIYGYNWFVSDVDEPVGDYRLTFSLDNSLGTPALNTSFGAGTRILLPVEEATPEVAPPDGGGGGGTPDQAGGVAKVLPEHNLTYIDVRILPTRGGGGRRTM